MTSNLFDVQIDDQMGIETKLEGVEVSVSYPPPSVHKFANDNSTVFRKNGTLSIRAAEFSGWKIADVFFLTNKDTGEQSRYEVSKQRHTPNIDGDWLTYSVSPVEHS